MPADRAKVRSALDITFKGKSVTKELKDSYATRWADKIATDDDIQSFIDDRTDDILDAAKEIDRNVSALQKAKKEAADAAKLLGDKKDEKTDTPVPDDLPADTPEWAKAILQEAKAARAEVTALKAEKQTETINERFKNHDSLKGIPAELLHGRYPKTEAEFEAAVESAATVLKPFVQAQSSTFGNDTPPGGTPKGGAVAKVDPDVLAFAKGKNEQHLQTTKTN